MFGTYSFGSRPIAAGPILFGAITIPPYHVNEVRLAVEVLGDAYVENPTTTVLVTRTVIEVLGLPVPFEGKHITVSRALAEVLAGAQSAVPGLGLEYTAPGGDLYAVLDLGNWASGGQFSLFAGDAPRLTLTGNATTLQIRWSDGANSVTAAVSTPSAPFLLSVRVPTTLAGAEIRVNGVAQSVVVVGTAPNPVTYTRMQGTAPSATLKSAELAELMAYPVSLTTARRDYIESYLTCKWLTPGCNPYTDLGPAP